MKSKLLQGLLLVLFVLAIVFLYFYWDEQSSAKLGKTHATQIQLNGAEQQYLKEHKTIALYVDENLEYLINEDGSGYLPDYMNRLFSPVGLQIRLTQQQNAADCSLMIIHKETREQGTEVRYTMPIFQMDGALFLRDDREFGDTMRGVVLANRLTGKRLRDLSYQGRKLEFEYAEDAQQAVEWAQKGQLDFILGDRSAVIAALGAECNFSALEDSLYTNNVCIMVPDSEETLYSIFNECINGVDRHQLTFELGQRWLDGNGPMYMRNSGKDYSVLALIIFMAVFIAFYLYYQSNKNLYAELKDRMNKLMESKKELQTTFDSVGHYMAELTLEGNILDVNKALYNFIDEEVYNKKIWDVLGLNEEEIVKLKVAVLGFNRKKQREPFEVEIKRRVLALDLFPIENARGITEKLLFMALDVTNERIAERQLLQDNKMIAVGQLAAGVAHEIRNPLGIIRNYCYVLKTMKDEEVQARAIEQIEKAVNTSGTIINNLLNFSRISKKQGEYIDLEEHINSLTSLNKNILKKKNIHITIEAREKIRPFVAVESLDMILINLISNATDAIEEEGSITIRMWKEKYFFFIEVADTGKGIEKEILQDIFNPFFTTKEGSKGNGLGLYIVYNELNKMNGQIHVASTIGEGTTFRMTLPLNEEDPEAEQKTEKEQ